MPGCLDLIVQWIRYGKPETYKLSGFQGSGQQCALRNTKGIIRVNDLYDDIHRRMLSANELAIKLDVHPMPCQSLIRMIPECCRSLLNIGGRVTREEDNTTLEILETKKIVRWAYLKIIRMGEMTLWGHCAVTAMTLRQRWIVYG